MSSGTWLDVDLLRQRRERFGHKRPEILPVRTLLLRGAAIGAALPLLLVFICVWFLIQEKRLEREAHNLQPLATEHDMLQLKIQTDLTTLEALVQTNKNLARSMADVRSSSALFGELQHLTPTTINFDQLLVNGDQLELSGEAAQPNGLRSVNSLILSLAASGLFKSDGVSLKRAQLRDPNQVQGSAGSDDRIIYSLTAAFAPDAVQAIRPQLLSLGADGLHQRLMRLEQEEDLL